MRSTAQPNATPRDPTELLGSVSSHSAGTTSMVRAAVLDDSDEISRQLSLGDSEPLRFTWLSRCADVVLLGFLGEVGFEHYALTDFFQEDEEGLNQGISLFIKFYYNYFKDCTFAPSQNYWKGAIFHLLWWSECRRCRCFCLLGRPLSPAQS